MSGLHQALSLIEQELSMTEPLVAKGAASEVEVLR
jgi:adhesin transport system membrane fusion protein